MLVDAGPLYAVADRGDRNHDRCRQLLEAAARPLFVPGLVATEVAYLLRTRLGPHAEVAFAGSIAAGELVIEPPEPSDWDRIAELCETYADRPLGIVDASVVALAERLGVDRLATLDHRHFTVVQPRHVKRLELLPG